MFIVKKNLYKEKVRGWKEFLISLEWGLLLFLKNIIFEKEKKLEVLEIKGKGGDVLVG